MTRSPDEVAPAQLAAWLRQPLAPAASPLGPPAAGIVALPHAFDATEVAHDPPAAVFGVLAPSRRPGQPAVPAHGLSAVVAVDVQATADDDKPWRWDSYGAVLADRFRVPTRLVVLVPRPRIERWTARRLALHALGGRAVQALLLGRDEVTALAERPVAEGIAELCRRALEAPIAPAPDPRIALARLIASCQARG